MPNRDTRGNGQRALDYRAMNEQEALLAVLHRRGWLNLALVRALLDDARLGPRTIEELLRFEQAGLLVRRRIPGGLVLFRAALPSLAIGRVPTPGRFEPGVGHHLGSRRTRG